MHKFLGYKDNRKFSYKEALKIYEAMHKEAVYLGAIGLENILEGLEVDLRISRIINNLSLKKRCLKD